MMKDAMLTKQVTKTFQNGLNQLPFAGICFISCDGDNLENESQGTPLQDPKKLQKHHKEK